MNNLLLMFDPTEGSRSMSFDAQELSSPDDDTTNNSYHTPKHFSTHLGSSSCSILASQDSLDIFHDASSTLHNSSPPNNAAPSKAPVRSSPTLYRHQRRRHFSSGAKFEDDRENREFLSDRDWDEADESTCMLPKCPVARIRHSGHFKGQGSKSCNASPFHVPRLSMSTNSLKRKSVDRMSWTASPQKLALIHQAGNSTTNNCGGGNMDAAVIKESEEMELNKEGGSKAATPAGGSFQTLPLANPTEEGSEERRRETEDDDPSFRWKNHYVPCVDLSSLYEKPVPGDADPIPAKFNGAQIFHSQKPIRRKVKTWEIIKEEFNLTNFKFNHASPHLFVTSQWQQPKQMCCMYLAYRLFWGVYFAMWGVWSWIGFAGYNSPSRLKGYYLIFLTNWGIWLLAFDTILQAVNVVLHMKKISEEGEARYPRMNSVFKFSWAVSTITTTLHIFITLFFWTTVYPKNKQSVTAVSVNTHMIQCLYVILDCFISATPRRVFHAYLPMGFLTVYGIFTNIYYLAGGTNHYGDLALYPLLDWSEQFKTLLIGSGIVMIIIPAIHTLIVCVIYGMRVKLWRSLSYNRYSHEIETAQSVSMEEKV